eukprot:756487-Hanusia_phi.AAC.3
MSSSNAFLLRRDSGDANTANVSRLMIAAELDRLFFCSNLVTIPGDGSCELPAQSFLYVQLHAVRNTDRKRRVADEDALGKLYAPLYDDEFFLLEGSPWQQTPRHVCRVQSSSKPITQLADCPAKSSTLSDTSLLVCSRSARNDGWGQRSGVRLIDRVSANKSFMQFINHKEIKMIRGDLEHSYVFGVEGEDVFKEGALNLFEDGYTIVLNDADILFPQALSSCSASSSEVLQVQKFVEALEEEFGLPIAASLHYSPEKSICGQMDVRPDEEVFVLQIEGSQIWLLAAPNISESSATTAQEDYRWEQDDSTEFLTSLHCTSNVSFLFGESIQLRMYLEKTHFTWNRFLHALVDTALNPSTLAAVVSADAKESLETWQCRWAPLHLRDVFHWLVYAVTRDQDQNTKTLLLARYGVMPFSDKSLDEEILLVSACAPVCLQWLIECKIINRLKTVDVVQQIQDALVARNGSSKGVFISEEWRRIEEKCPESWKQVLNSPDLQSEIEFLISIYMDR